MNERVNEYNLCQSYSSLPLARPAALPRALFFLLLFDSSLRLSLRTPSPSPVLFTSLVPPIADGRLATTTDANVDL